MENHKQKRTVIQKNDIKSKKTEEEIKNENRELEKLLYPSKTKKTILNNKNIVDKRKK